MRACVRACVCVCVRERVGGFAYCILVLCVHLCLFVISVSAPWIDLYLLPVVFLRSCYVQSHFTFL